MVLKGDAAMAERGTFCWECNGFLLGKKEWDGPKGIVRCALLIFKVASFLPPVFYLSSPR